MPVLGTGGRAFESRYPDKIIIGVCWNWYTGMSKEHVGYAREGSIPSTPTKIICNGGVAERFNAAVLKTVDRDERSVGSNPASSANLEI